MSSQNTEKKETDKIATIRKIIKDCQQDKKD